MDKDIANIQAVGTDLKMSIDDLIYHIKTIKEDVEKLKQSKDKNISNA